MQKAGQQDYGNGGVVVKASFAGDGAADSLRGNGGAISLVPQVLRRPPAAATIRSPTSRLSEGRGGTHSEATGFAFVRVVCCKLRCLESQLLMADVSKKIAQVLYIRLCQFSLYQAVLVAL